jgi:hypothetical protein
MIDALIALNIYIFPVAFALLFAAGIRLYLNTRHWTMAAFSAGTGMVLFSQVIIFGVYQIFPAVYEHDVGVVPHQIRENIYWVASFIGTLGLVVGSLALTLYAFKAAGRNNAT